MSLKTGPPLNRKEELGYLRRKTIIGMLEQGQLMIVRSESTEQIERHPNWQKTQREQGLAHIDFALELIGNLPVLDRKDIKEASA